ncbi:hypothetical protein PMAYCL1PPCAC_03761, partial [Pristionchus mayeri]
VSLACYSVIAAFGVSLNTVVLVSFIKGKLAQPPFPSIYILVLQTLIVDVISISIHLFYWIPKAINQDFLRVPGYDFLIITIFDFIGMYSWFHNALSHIFIASNRFAVIVFFERSFFTRRRVIIMAVAHHLLSFFITLLTQHGVPCCRLTFDFEIFSYSSVPNGNMLNYGDLFVTVPVNLLSTLTSLICYTTIILTVRSARRGSGTVMSQKRKSEYRYALQFASLAGVFSLCWISFRAFAYFVPSSDPSLAWIFGLTTGFTMVNCFMNALVYLITNKDVSNS